MKKYQELHDLAQKDVSNENKQSPLLHVPQTNVCFEQAHCRLLSISAAWTDKFLFPGLYIETAPDTLL